MTTKTATSRARPIARLIQTGAASLALLSGCMNERHLIGEGPPAGTGGADSGGSAGSSGGAPPDASTGSPDASAPAPDASTDSPELGPSPDASDASTADVIGLGDEPPAGWPLTISPQEVAKRLSQFILRQPPSAALTTAIVAAAPRTNQDVGQLAEGLLLQEGSVAGRAAFYRWWLSFDSFATVTRDPTLFPLLTDAVRQAFLDQTVAFIEDVTWRADGDLATLLTEPAAYVSAATASWYPGSAAVATGTEMTRVTLDPTFHAGLVTQPPLVASGPFPKRPEPSRRGRDVLTRFLCTPVPLEPPDSSLIATEIPAGMTIRQGVSAATGSGPCSACHSFIDPVGFAFGHFDAVGAFQLTEGGLTIDTAGELRAAGGQGFSGASDLARILADLPAVTTCFALKWLAFARGTPTNADDVSSSSTDDTVAASDAAYVVKRATVSGGLNLRATIRAVTETHTFLDP
jgi:hypothetical protein